MSYVKRNESRLCAGGRAGTGGEGGAGRQAAWADLPRVSTETSTPSATAVTSRVETTAMTGSDSSRMLSYIFLGNVAASRPAMKSATTASLNDERNANSA